MSSTMVMDTVQIRLSPKIVKVVDSLVKSGVYSSRSDVMRDAVRRLILDRMVGIIPNKGDSIKEVKDVRKELSKSIRSIKDINKILE